MSEDDKRHQEILDMLQDMSEDSQKLDSISASLNKIMLILTTLQGTTKTLTEGQNKHTEEMKALEGRVTSLDRDLIRMSTQFKIAWGAMALIGGTSITALISAIFKLVSN